MKMVVEKDENYPVYCIYHLVSSTTDKVVELSDQEIDRCKAAFKEFYEVQDLLMEKYNERR